MKGKIIKGEHTDANIQKCYDYILELDRKNLRKLNNKELGNKGE